MHCQCDGRPTVTFPVAGHHRRLTGTRLCCLVTEADTCETSLPKAVTWQLNGQELDSAKSRVSPKNCTTSPQVLVNESADLYCCCWCIKGVQYSSLQLASLLQELMCHMGSHNLTCHQAEVTFHLTPAEAGTRCSNPGGIQDWVDLVGWLRTEMKVNWDDIPAWRQNVSIPVLTLCDAVVMLCRSASASVHCHCSWSHLLFFCMRCLISCRSETATASLHSRFQQRRYGLRL